MEFPITRERLQNYRANEAISVETKQRVLKEIQKICKDVEFTVLNTNDTRYIYRISRDITNPNCRPTGAVHCDRNSRPNILAQPVKVLNELLIAIKNTFPDSNIVVDPLETYIVIDWS
jgi:hypothetical protein